MFIVEKMIAQNFIVLFCWKSVLLSNFRLVGLLEIIRLFSVLVMTDILGIILKLKICYHVPLVIIANAFGCVVCKQ